MTGLWFQHSSSLDWMIVHSGYKMLLMGTVRSNVVMPVTLTMYCYYYYYYYYFIRYRNPKIRP
jgi:hypothetical protein